MCRSMEHGTCYLPVMNSNEDLITLLPMKQVIRMACSQEEENKPKLYSGIRDQFRKSSAGYFTAYKLSHSE